MIGLWKNKFRNLAKIFLTTRQNSNFYKILAMNQAYFKHNMDDEEKKMVISFRFQKQITETKKLDKNFNFMRKINEKIDTTLNRIKCNVEKELSIKSRKKNKKNAQSSSTEVGNEDPDVSDEDY